MNTIHKLFICLLSLGLFTGLCAQTDGDEPPAKEQDAIQSMLSQFMNQSKKEVNLPDVYAFDISMVIEGRLNEKNENDRIKMFFSEESGKFAVEMDDNLIVSDQSEDIMITYNKKAKTANYVPNILKGLTNLFDEEKVEVESVKNMGETKSILGYEAKYYQITTDDGIVDLWLTDEIKFDFVKAMDSVLGGSLIARMTDPNFMELMRSHAVLHSISKNKKTGDINEMKVVEIGKGMVITNSEYEFTNAMSGM